MTPQRAAEILTGSNEWTGPTVDSRMMPGERAQVVGVLAQDAGKHLFYRRTTPDRQGHPG